MLMKKILLVWLPFCTPVSPPYSLTNLYSFLKKNCSDQIEVLDLNIEYHKNKFPDYQKYYHDQKWDDYEEKTAEFQKLTAKVYAENNRLVVKGEKPEFFEEMLNQIKKKKADVIAFSIVYSSQAFYAYSLMKELDNVVIGGPAVNSKISPLAAKVLNNEVELLEYITGSHECDMDYFPDFSIYPLKEYFTPDPVIPIKTTNTCFYKGCTFCNHFSKTPYYEFPLEHIEKAVANYNNIFLIDDMIPTKRLLELAKIFKGKRWACQLRPTKDLDLKTLNTLKKAGITFIIWGVESGNDRVLKKIRKGTNIKDISQVLSDSHKTGIKNAVFIMFGFPTETEEELLETIDFLKENQQNIELILISIFGLQKGTYVFDNPKEFGIIKITEKPRTVLEPQITYEVSEGLSHKEAAAMRSKYKKTIEQINNYPKSMNFFREHMFFD